MGGSSSQEISRSTLKSLHDSQFRMGIVSVGDGDRSESKMVVTDMLEPGVSRASNDGKRAAR